jgi:hypothetical protein
MARPSPLADSTVTRRWTIKVPQLDPLLCAGSGITSNTAQAELEILPL